MGIVAVDLDVGQFGGESRMAAMIRPICVDDFEFRKGGDSALAYEIVTHEFEILNAHGKSLRGVIFGYLFVGKIGKALDVGDDKVGTCLLNERFGQSHISFPAVDGVDEIMLYALHLALAHARKGIDRGALDERARAHGKQLHALHGAVRALIVLSGQIFGDEHLITVHLRERVFIDVVDGRFAEYGVERLFENVLVQALDVVSDELSHIRNGDTEHAGDVVFGFDGGDVAAFFLFNVNSLYHIAPVKV